jgi:transglutaminase-like putative cysteine protease/tetratricopeptide (TPR) repeat protein
MPRAPLRLAICATALSTLAASAALAGDKPLIQPAPAWVLPPPPLATLARDHGDSGILILDQQQRLLDGQVWAYVDSANRITSEQTLNQAGTVKLAWQPDHGDLIVHRITILRGSQEINLLTDAEPFTVLRRERGLEQLMIDGVLTATMPVKGLQVGDVLRVSYSTISSDPVLKGDMQGSEVLFAAPTRAAFGRARLLWKSDRVQWRALTEVKGAKLATVDGFKELTVMLPLPKPADMPNDAPLRYRPLPVLEASSFTDWATVSKVMAPLYKTQGTIPAGSPLAAEVDRIKAASTDPRTRAALALQTVQSEVRYLFNGLNGGNYVPQTPEKTWTVRYGDCKAKTLLLLAMLDGLGIKAEPVLANIGAGDYLPKRLPSAAAFNHVLVQATIDGKTMLLDGTAGGARLADLGDTPNFRYVLPVRAEGATLQPIETRPNARPGIEVAEDVDQSAGIGIAAPFNATITVRGPLAEQLKTATASITADKKKEMVDGIVQRMLRPGLMTSRDIAYDAATGSATIKAAGLTGADWDREDQRYEWTLDKVVKEIKFEGDRSRPEWRDIPVATPGIMAAVWRTKLRLPEGGKGFTLEGDQSFAEPLAGTLIKRQVAMAGGVVTVEDRVDEVAAEIPPAAVAATKSKLAQARQRLLKLVAPRDYPRRWEVIAAARKAGKLAPVEAAYAQAIEAAPEKWQAYLARAGFRTSVFDRKGAIADLDKVIAERPDVDTYLLRGSLYRALHQDAKALADAKAAFALDPGADSAVTSLAELQAEQGQLDAALALVDEHIAAGGDTKTAYQGEKAELLARAGRAEPALATLDEAIKEKPADASLYNNRCWQKGTLGVQLDTAIRDCNRAIELGYQAAALDSRAMIYFKQKKFDEALADLDATLDIRPEQAGSLYLRAAVLQAKGGDAARAASDLEGARTINPRIDEEYARYGVSAGAAKAASGK